MNKSKILEETEQLMPQFEKRGGLLPVAVQESGSGQILMLGSVSKEALEMTLKTRYATFFSTSRQEIWVKGTTSGNRLKLDKILIDCDQDAFVFQVTLEKGGVCHTFNEEGNNRKACFYRALHVEKTTLHFIEK